MDWAFFRNPQILWKFRRKTIRGCIVPHQRNRKRISPRHCRWVMVWLFFLATLNCGTLVNYLEQKAAIAKVASQIEPEEPLSATDLKPEPEPTLNAQPEPSKKPTVISPMRMAPRSRDPFQLPVFSNKEQIKIGRRISQVFYVPDSRKYIVWSKGNGIHVVDIETLKIEKDLSFLADAELVSVGRRTLATYSRDRNRLRFFDLKNFKEFKNLQAPSFKVVYGIAIDPAFDQAAMVFGVGTNSKLTAGLLDLKDFSYTKLTLNDYIPLRGGFDSPSFGQARTTFEFRYFQLRTDVKDAILLQRIPFESQFSYVEQARSWSDSLGADGVHFLGHRVENTYYGFHLPRGMREFVGQTYNLQSETGYFSLKISMENTTLTSYEDLQLSILISLFDLRKNDFLGTRSLNFSVPNNWLNPDQTFKSSGFILENLSFALNEQENLILIQAGTTLSIYPFDWPSFDAELPPKTLLVLSGQPIPPYPGDSLTWQIRTLSGSEALGYEVVHGPSGLKVDKKGQVTWVKPKSSEGLDLAVIRITNGGGGETYYAFKI